MKLNTLIMSLALFGFVNTTIPMSNELPNQENTTVAVELNASEPKPAYTKYLLVSDDRYSMWTNIAFNVAIVSFAFTFAYVHTYGPDAFNFKWNK